jgi:hypothetical protein
MADGQTITFSPSQIDQPGQQPAATTAAPTGQSITFSPQDMKPAIQPPTATSSSAPGAYQQSPGGPIHNANDDAAHPFTDSVTSILAPGFTGGQTGALMKRDDESDPQFFARAIEAGKHVNLDQLEAEHSANKKAAPYTLAAAGASGVAQVGSALPLTAAAETAGAGLSMARAGGIIGAHLSGKALDWVAANPVKAYVFYQTVGTAGAAAVKKVLQVFNIMGEGSEK